MCDDMRTAQDGRWALAAWGGTLQAWWDHDLRCVALMASALWTQGESLFFHFPLGPTHLRLSCSAIPEVPSGGNRAAVMMMAEKASEMIFEDLASRQRQRQRQQQVEITTTTTKHRPSSL